MNDLFIRTATPEDAALITKISRETFYNTYAAFNTKANMDKYMNEVFTIEKLEAERNLPDNIFLLAYSVNQAKGYVFLKDKSIPEIALCTDDILEIARIYVATNQTGKGIGA